MRGAALCVVLMLLGCGKVWAPPAAEGPTAERKWIRTAQLRLAVDDADATTRRLEQLAAEAGGWIADETRHGEAATVQLRVPEPKLVPVLAQVRGLGEVQTEVRHSEDATAPHADLTARLEAARALEKELLSLYATPGAKLPDLVAVESKLGEVRERIETLEAQRRGLDAKIDFAQVDVELAPRQLAGPYLGQAASAFRGSAAALGQAIQLVGLAVVLLLPWTLLATPVVVLVRWRRRQARVA
jgi:hypothetical protein